jgi:hypothetical protein
MCPDKGSKPGHSVGKPTTNRLTEEVNTFIITHTYEYCVEAEACHYIRR